MRIFSNTAMSLDGKISAHRDEHVGLGSEADLRRMSALRASADAVLVGGQTFRNWPIPLVERAEHRRADRQGPIVNAVLTRRGLLGARPTSSRWPDERVKLLIFGPRGLDAAAHRDRFGAEVITADNPDVEWVLATLEARGCRRVLVEGGGRLIHDVVTQDRLDEIFVTVCPLLVGVAGAPTPLDGTGFRPGEFPELTLLSCERAGDELFLHYSVKHAPA